ncbi:MAG: DMT family transporter [Acinetobacter sp.]
MLFKISLAMIAFAANSVLCRFALAQNQIDPMSFSTLRVLSGVVVLSLLFVIAKRNSNAAIPLNWKLKNGFYLAVYIVAFSLAYVKIDAGVGALLLFGTVQFTMVVYGLCHGEKINFKRAVGLVLAFVGICILLLPGANAPSIGYSMLMVISGIAWAAYSLSGKNSPHPLSSTYTNFVLAVPFVIFAGFLFAQDIHAAYVLWYSILKHIDRIMASTVQLSVPCLAIIGGSLFIGESIGSRILLSSTIVLCGILLVIFAVPKR